MSRKRANPDACSASQPTQRRRDDADDPDGPDAGNASREHGQAASRETSSASTSSAISTPCSIRTSGTRGRSALSTWNMLNDLARNRRRLQAEQGEDILAATTATRTPTPTQATPAPPSLAASATPSAAAAHYCMISCLASQSEQELDTLQQIVEVAKDGFPSRISLSAFTSYHLDSGLVALAVIRIDLLLTIT
jgi:hypothetical protein